MTSLWLAILVNGSRKTYLSLDKDRRVDGFGIFPYTEAVIFLNDYGKDQGQHGEDEVLGMQAHHGLHEAEQEEGEREALSQQILSVLPEAHAAQ